MCRNGRLSPRNVKPHAVHVLLLSFSCCSAVCTSSAVSFSCLERLWRIWLRDWPDDAPNPAKSTFDGSDFDKNRGSEGEDGDGGSAREAGR